jgi:hypothetical protein
MTLILNQGTTPNNLEVKTHRADIEADVRIGNNYVSLADFCSMVEYVLTNTDLTGPDDPRVGLVEKVRGMQTTTGYSATGTRFALPN